MLFAVNLEEVMSERGKTLKTTHRLERLFLTGRSSALLEQFKTFRHLSAAVRVIGQQWQAKTLHAIINFPSLLLI